MKHHTPQMQLIDDGTLDGVFRCLGCGAVVRLNPEVYISDDDVDEPAPQQLQMDRMVSDAEEYHLNDLQRKYLV